jgi:hypothetical protein
MAANVIDSFFIALGFKVDTSGGAQLKKQTDDAKTQLLSLGRAVKAFATAYVVKSVVDISDSFEQNTIAISGFLEALEFSKAGAGMADAADIIQQITNDAAKLPGEAEEYIEVFRAGLPVLKGAMPGGSLQELTAFTNRFAAIGKTLQVDAGQIGRDLSLMLGPKGRAGGNVLTFQRMLPFIRQLKGHATETAESFNVLTQPARLALLQEALANPALSSMLERSAGSFDAMLGAAKSMVKTLVRLSTAGLFKGLKDGLDSVRSIFIDDGGKLTSTGETFVSIMQKIGYAVTRMIRLGGIVAKTLIRFAASSIEVKLGLFGIAGAVIGLQKLLRFGLIGAILLLIEDLHTFYEGGRSITGMLVKEWPGAINVVKGLLAALGLAFVVMQAKSIAAAVATGAAWTVANFPLILMLASVAALIVAFATLIAKWDYVKNSFKHWPKIAGAKGMDVLDKVFGSGNEHYEDRARANFGKDVEDIDFTKRGRLGPGALGPAYSGSALSMTPTAPASYGPSQADAQGHVWEKVRPGNTTNNTTINVNGARDPKLVADEVDKIQQRRNRNVIRSSQKGHKL